VRILLAIDDSAFSAAALEAVATRFRTDNAEVRVLHVAESAKLTEFPPLSFGTGPMFAGEYAVLLEKWRQNALELVSQAARRLQALGFKAKPVFLEGDAKRDILNYACRWGADLIVVGSHGRGGLDRFLLGSVSEATARHAHCSVFIVRSSQTGPRNQADSPV
jgi:nucleotide-binding universal stress UspA family protein